MGFPGTDSKSFDFICLLLKSNFLYHVPVLVYNLGSREKFSVAMAILHLLARPLTTLCLAKIAFNNAGRYLQLS